jgi:group I intron endonuclease
MIGVYKIQSKKKHKRVYIGSSINIRSRWHSHLSDLKNNLHTNKKLQDHVNKYGLDDLIFIVIVACDMSNMLEYEQFFIDAYSPYFNIRTKALTSFIKGIAYDNNKYKKRYHKFLLKCDEDGIRKQISFRNHKRDEYKRRESKTTKTF